MIWLDMNEATVLKTELGAARKKLIPFPFGTVPSVASNMYQYRCRGVCYIVNARKVENSQISMVLVFI
jgi:hypothetical protein